MRFVYTDYLNRHLASIGLVDGKYPIDYEINQSTSFKITTEAHEIAQFL